MRYWGHAYRDLGATSEVIDYYECALEILNKLYVASHLYVVDTLHNLGGCIYHVQALTVRQQSDEATCTKVSAKNHYKFYTSHLL